MSSPVAVPEQRQRKSRSEILQDLRAKIGRREPIVAAGASVGIVAKAAEAGGADLLVVYSTGRSRIMGLPTTEIGHSNPVTLSMLAELDNVVDRTPIVGGAEAGDPTYRRLPRLVEDFRAIGYDGIINFPSAASNPTRAEMRAHLGLGLRREAEMMTLAGKAGLLTMAYAWTIEQAQLMTDAGVDILVAHAGWTVGGSAGRDAESISVAASVEHVQRVIEATWAINPDCICLAHGGALAEPADTEYLYRTTDAQGFVGASSIERIPIERAVQQTVEAFKSARLR